MRNTLQHSTIFNGRRLQDPNQRKAEVSPVPAVGISFDLMPGDEKLLIFRRAREKLLARNGGKKLQQRLRPVESIQQRAVFGDNLAPDDAHLSWCVIRGHELQISALRREVEQSHCLLFYCFKNLRRNDFGHLDKTVFPESLAQINYVL